MSFSSVRPALIAVPLGIVVLLLLSSATLWVQMLRCPHRGSDSSNNDSHSKSINSTFRISQTYTDSPDVGNHTYSSRGVRNYNNMDDHHFKQPNTPPKSLPSDRYAHYIYQQELSLSDFTSNKKRSTRTIVIGDIHGNLKGFNRFLKKIKFNPSKDTIVLAGDIVAKGPHSLKVIDRAIKLDAKCVRGNHDDKVIRWRGFLDSLSGRQLEDLESETEEDLQHSRGLVDDNKGWESVPSEIGKDNDTETQQLRIQARIPSDLDKASEHYHIAKKMSKRQYNYLKNCPLILTLPRKLSVKNIPIHVIHAGIDPHRSILKQEPWVLTNVRNLLEDGTPSRKKNEGRGWAMEFNELHKRRSLMKQDFLIVYGHDAGRSLNVMPWSIGLDTGCVYGRELTGYVVETGRIISVPCPAGV